MNKPTEQLATEVRKGHDLREPAVATMARALVNERGEVILDLIANKQAAAKLAEFLSGPVTLVAVPTTPTDFSMFGGTAPTTGLYLAWDGTFLYGISGGDEEWGRVGFATWE